MVQTNNSYVAQLEAWRQQREAELRAPDGWFSLVNLYMLRNGYHSIGSDVSNDITLPPSAPAQLGILAFRNGRAKLTITTRIPVLVDGIPVQSVELVDINERRKPTLVTVGTVTFFLHRFGDQYAIRVKDSSSPAIATFAGCEWFPVNPAYRVLGHFTRYDAPHPIPIKTIVNTNTHYKSVGTLSFVLDRHPFNLLATDYGVPNQLSVILRDATSGKQTYGPARFLTVELADDEQVVIDFNKAINPPCAFSAYATCPLPPRENSLPVAIEAGERYSPIGTHRQVEPTLFEPA